MIYLDNAATTRLDPEVLDAMLPYLQDRYGNPGSLHTLGREASTAVESARRRVASLFGCRPDEVYFTSACRETAPVVGGDADEVGAVGRHGVEEDGCRG